MRRRLLNLLTALSLVLCVAVCGLWVRSHFASNKVFYAWEVTRRDGYDQTELAAQTSIGTLALTRSWTRGKFVRGAEPGTRVGFWEWNSGLPFGSSGPVVFVSTPDYWRGEDGEEMGGRTAGCALWVPAVFFALLPARRLYRRSRRHGPGLCRHCGYDLRATPGRCPECGRARAAESRAG